MPPQSPSESAIAEWCLEHIRQTVGDPSIAVAPDITFAEMGLDSATSAYFIVELEEWLGRELDPELLVEHPTIATLVRHLAGGPEGGDGG